MPLGELSSNSGAIAIIAQPPQADALPRLIVAGMAREAEVLDFVSAAS